MITAPGVYEMSTEEYLADPVLGGSLSSSGARLILSTCPAMFQHRRQYPDRATDAMTLGTAAHAVILGAGRQPVEIPEDVLSKSGSVGTAAARDFILLATQDGRTPLKSREFTRVQKMAAAIRQHPVAGKRFIQGHGKPEQVLVWQDERTGVWCRAMLDWLSNGHRITDLKTAESASERAFRAAVIRYRYDMQAAWYMTGVRAVGIDNNPDFEFVVMETTSPYLVAVYTLDDDWLRLAALDNRKAIDLYKRCIDTEEWPGYPDAEPLSAPGWMESDVELTL